MPGIPIPGWTDVSVIPSLHPARNDFFSHSLPDAPVFASSLLRIFAVPMVRAMRPASPQHPRSLDCLLAAFSAARKALLAGCGSCRLPFPVNNSCTEPIVLSPWLRPPPTLFSCVLVFRISQPHGSGRLARRRLHGSQSAGEKRTQTPFVHKRRSKSTASDIVPRQAGGRTLPVDHNFECEVSLTFSSSRFCPIPSVDHILHSLALTAFLLSQPLLAVDFV